MVFGAMPLVGWSDAAYGDQPSGGKCCSGYMSPPPAAHVAFFNGPPGLQGNWSKATGVGRCMHLAKLSIPCPACAYFTRHLKTCRQGRSDLRAVRAVRLTSREGRPSRKSTSPADSWVFNKLLAMVNGIMHIGCQVRKTLRTAPKKSKAIWRPNCT